MTVARVMQTLMIVVCAAAAALSSAASAATCPGACECFAADNGIPSANCTGLPDDRAAGAWPQKNLRVRPGGRDAAPAVVLRDGAFRRFPRLAYLDVADVPVRYVANAAFDGLPELLELNLVGAGVRLLHRDTFAGNRKLAFLSLKRNGRLAVGPAFLVSDSVTELDLSECGLTALKSVYFAGLPGLKYLFAARNRLKTLGPQFGPPGLKYADLAHNRIETVRDDLEAYKRLRTVDMTGNPVECTCDLSRVDRRLAARGVAFGDTVACHDRAGRPLADVADEACADDKDPTAMSMMMMGDEPADMFKADGLLKIDQKQWQSMAENDDLGGSGSGSGDYGPADYYTSSAGPDTTVAAVASTSESGTPAAAGDSGPTSTVRPSSAADPADVVVAVDSGEEAAAAEESDDSTEQVVVAVGRVEPTAKTSGGDNGTSTARSGTDGGIVPLTIQAPEEVGGRGGAGDGAGADDVQTKVAEYLKTNVGVTGTAVVLAVVIVAIVYKAVCVGKKRSPGDAAAGEKSVELKEIKYMAADTEDSHDRHRHIDSPSDGSVEENHLLDGDRDSDDDDDGDGDGDDGDDGGVGASPPPPGNGNARNGDLLNSVMDAVKSASGDGQPAADVPTRVVVKLGETPKTSKPVAIDNVQ